MLAFLHFIRFPSLICASRQTVNIQLTQHSQSRAYTQQSLEKRREHALYKSVRHSLFPKPAHVA